MADAVWDGSELGFPLDRAAPENCRCFSNAETAFSSFGDHLCCELHARRFKLHPLGGFFRHAAKSAVKIMYRNMKAQSAAE